MQRAGSHTGAGYGAPQRDAIRRRTTFGGIALLVLVTVALNQGVRAESLVADRCGHHSGNADRTPTIERVAHESHARAVRRHEPRGVTTTWCPGTACWSDALATTREIDRIGPRTTAARAMAAQGLLGLAPPMAL